MSAKCQKRTLVAPGAQIVMVQWRRHYIAIGAHVSLGYRLPDAQTCKPVPQKREKGPQ